MAKPENYRTLIEYANAKTSKGEALGILTGIVYLAPANESGRGNVCGYKTVGCETGCLYMAGRGPMPNVISARIDKTHFYFDNRAAFLDSLRYDIEALIRKAERENLIPAVRINGTSDLPWIALQMAKEYPTVQFYDYTKLPKAWLRVRSNYHITFSHSENNLDECVRALEHGLNVAVVFDTHKNSELPSEFLGRPVIDGDLHDVRFLDGHKGAIIGLRAKGPAKKDESGFVVKTDKLVQITLAA